MLFRSGSSARLQNFRVLNPVGLSLQELLAADTEVFFKERGVTIICLENSDADVAQGRHETDHGREGLVSYHLVRKPRRNTVSKFGRD